MGIGRGKNTSHADPLIDHPGKTLEFPTVHLLAPILPQPPLQTSFLGGTGRNRQNHFILLFLYLVSYEN